MPVTENLPDQWYNTPNLHMCTLRDFFNFCKERQIKVFKSLALKGEKTLNINTNNISLRNLDSQLGIFLIQN